MPTSAQTLATLIKVGELDIYDALTGNHLHSINIRPPADFRFIYNYCVRLTAHHVTPQSPSKLTESILVLAVAGLDGSVVVYRTSLPVSAPSGFQLPDDERAEQDALDSDVPKISSGGENGDNSGSEA